MEILLVALSVALVAIPVFTEVVCTDAIFYPEINPACLSALPGFLSGIEPYLFIPGIFLAWFLFKRNHKVLGLVVALVSGWSLMVGIFAQISSL